MVMRVKQKIIDFNLEADSRICEFDLLAQLRYAGISELHEMAVKPQIGAGLRQVRLLVNGCEFLRSSVVHLNELAKYYGDYRRGYIRVMRKGLDTGFNVRNERNVIDVRMIFDYEHKKTRGLSLILIGVGSF